MKAFPLCLLTTLVACFAPTALHAEAPETSTGFPMHAEAPAGLDDIYSFYTTNFGFVPNMAQVMANSPALMRSYVDVQNNLKASAKLSQAEINIVQMAIAVENKCKYCTAGHTMAGKMFFKTPAEHMQAVRMRQQLNDPKLNALRSFAITLYENKGQVDEQTMKSFLEAGYTREQALDVVACVAAKVMSNFTNSLAKTPIDAPMLPLAEGLSFDE